MSSSMGRIIEKYMKWKIKFMCETTNQCFLIFPAKQFHGWLAEPTPLKNMSSSIGMMTFPIYPYDPCMLYMVTFTINIPQSC